MFTDGVALPKRAVRYRMDGEFRRPGSDSWEPMTDTEYIAAGEPAIVFAGTTWVRPGLWARPMNAFVGGTMDMRALILPTIAVVTETGNPELDYTSPRRCLLWKARWPRQRCCQATRFIRSMSTMIEFTL